MRVLLKELSVVRVRCTKCQRVTEVSSDDVGEAFKHNQCPHCRQNFPQEISDNAFVKYAEAVKKLCAMDGVEIEFSIPVDGD